MFILFFCRWVRVSIDLDIVVIFVWSVVVVVFLEVDILRSERFSIVLFIVFGVWVVCVGEFFSIVV